MELNCQLGRYIVLSSCFSYSDLSLFVRSCNMFPRHLVTGFSRKYGRISKGALEGSSVTNPREISPRVSASVSTNFHAFSIPFRNADGLLDMASKSSSLLIQVSSLRKNNNLFTSVINDPLDMVSRYSNNRVLSYPRRASIMITIISPTHRTQKPFYIISRGQTCPALVENYASELHQVMILRLSRVGQTSCEQMVSYGRVHFMFFHQNVILFCMIN
jgi:hypothetical protein